MADFGITIFFRKTGTAAWLAYRDYVRHIIYGLIRSGLPVAYSEGFRHRVAVQAPQALPLAVASLGEPFHITLLEAVDVNLQTVVSFFAPDEAPVALSHTRWKGYLSVFDTPVGIVKVDLERQSLRQVLENLGVKPWETIKVAMESKEGTTLVLK